MQHARRDKITYFFKTHDQRRAFYLAGVATASWTIGHATPELTAEIVNSGFAIALSNAPLADTLTAAQEFFRGALSYSSGLAKAAADGIAATGSSTYDHLRQELEMASLSAGEITERLRSNLSERAMMIGELAAVARSSTNNAFATISGHLPKSAAEIIPWCVTAGTVVLAYHETIKKCRDLIVDTVKTFNVFNRKGAKKEESVSDISARADDAGLTPQAMNGLTINIAIGGDRAGQAVITSLQEAIRTNDTSIVSDPGKLIARLEEAIAIDDVARRKRYEEQVNRQRQEAMRTRAMEMFTNARPDRTNSDLRIRYDKLTGLENFEQLAELVQSRIRTDTAFGALVEKVWSKPTQSERLAGCGEDLGGGVVMNNFAKIKKACQATGCISIDAKNKISDTYMDIVSP